MRIGVDATALYGRYGGVEYALWNLLFALNATDDANEYCVYIPSDGPPPSHLENFQSHWRWVRLPFRGAEKLKRIFWQQAVLPFQLRADDCDILHAPTYVLPLKINIRVRPRVPTVLTVYDLIALDHPAFATPLNRLHYSTLLPRSLSRADRIIVPSEAVRNAIIRRIPQSQNKIRIVPLGLEPIFFREPSTQALVETRARYSLPQKFVLFIGNFEPKKNLDNLLKAMELLPNAPPLIIAGGAKAWKQIESSPRVRTIGYVPRRDLPALYTLCETFVFPSLAEGFGLPVLEALACGAPVVTSTRVPLPDLQGVLWCDPHEPRSIAVQLEDALNDESLREGLRRMGKQYALPFTWRRAAEQTSAIYREIL